MHHLFQSTKSKQQRELETIDNMQKAVEIGCRLIRTHFKRIDIRPEDFDEDDDPTFAPEPIFEPLVRLKTYLRKSSRNLRKKWLSIIFSHEENG